MRVPSEPKESIVYYTIIVLYYYYYYYEEQRENDIENQHGRSILQVKSRYKHAKPSRRLERSFVVVKRTRSSTCLNRKNSLNLHRQSFTDEKRKLSYVTRIIELFVDNY